MVKSALLLPAHGHAPYILGVRILSSVTDEICVPHYYGETQRKILREEFPNDADRIFLSESLGALFKPLLRAQSSVPTFKVFAANINSQFEEISRKLESMLRGGIAFTSLNGKAKTFSHFDFVLNTGLPVFSPVAPVFFAFVGKMSAVYSLSPYRGDDTLSLARTWIQVEKTFAREFVPRLSSLSYLEYDVQGITFTPPFTRPYPLDDTPIKKDVLLIVTSGTGMDVEKLKTLAAETQTPCFTLAESPAQIDLPRLPSRAWGNPNIAAVLARSGLGTIWQAYLNQKPIGVLTSEPQDDPEVYHNAQMVQWSGIGNIIQDDVSPLMENLAKYQTAIQQHLIMDKQIFGTIDGIEFTANQIKNALNKSAQNLPIEREQHEQLLAR